MPKKTDDAVNRRLAALAAARPKGAEAPAPASSKKKRGRADRRATYRIGRVICDNRSEAPCVLKDLSDTGARIILEGEAGLSPRVILRIDQTGERRAARVAWQRGREAGLDFE